MRIDRLCGAALLVLPLLMLGGRQTPQPTEAPRPLQLVTYVPPRHYLCYRAGEPIRVDGRLDKPVWRDAPWTDWFVDIEGVKKPLPRFKTRVKMLWDDDYFYVGAEL